MYIFPSGLKMDGKPELLIFDWDGTLMDSEARIVACMQAAAADLKFRIPDPDNTKNIIGLGLLEAISTLFPELDKGAVVAMSERYRHHFLHENEKRNDLVSDLLHYTQKLTIGFR